MKKITLLILAAMFCIGTLTLLGCADEPEVLELEPVEEIQEEPDAEEVVELEPEPLYFGEEIEPTISEAELNAIITETANRMTTTGPWPTTKVQNNLEIILEYANGRPLPNPSNYDTAAFTWQVLMEFDHDHNNLQVLKAMRDSRTNSVLRDAYEDLINAMESNRGNAQGYIDAVKIIDHYLHPETIGERQVLPFFQSTLGSIMGKPDTTATINGESMTLAAGFATNKLPIQQKYREIRAKINAGELD